MKNLYQIRKNKNRKTEVKKYFCLWLGEFRKFLGGSEEKENYQKPKKVVFILFSERKIELRFALVSYFHSFYCVLNNLVAENVQTDVSLPAHKEPVRKDPPGRANLSNRSKYDNRYANIVNSRHFPRRPGASLTQSKLPHQSSYSQYSNQLQLPQPIFSFRNTSFVDYRSSAF